MKHKASYVKCMRILQHIILMISFPLIVIGQSSPQPPSVPIPPSPTAASLGKVAELPVSLATGTPSVDIPIYTLTDRDVSVPISLSYHASGVRVEETPAWVGLGWSLNAGGVITRTVKGLPDGTGNSHPANNTPLNAVLESELATNGYAFTTQGLLNYDSRLELMALGGKSMEPDLFVFNVGGMTGEIIFDHQGTPRVIPHQDILVKESSFGTGRWELVVPNGTRYIFGKTLDGSRTAVEETETFVECSGSDPQPPARFASSWYLLEVISPNDLGNIQLHYTTNTMEYDTRLSETRYNKDQSLAGMHDVLTNWTFSNFTFNTFNVGNLPPQECESNMFVYNHQILDRIESDHFKVEFMSSSREDIKVGGVKLDEIRILGATSSLLKKYVFNYDYFYATQNVPGHPTIPEYLKKRLRLDQIHETAADGLTLPPHVFTYFENSNVKLPPRNSYAQDYWGFYNGKNSNQTLIPSEVFGVLSGMPNGADRSPDAQMMQAGTLVKVTYPTGGFIKLFYEPHDYGYASQYDYISVRDKISPVSISGSAIPRNNCVWSANANNPNCAVDEIIIDVISDQPQTATVGWILEYTGGPLPPQGAIGEVRIEPLDNQRNGQGGVFNWIKVYDPGCNGSCTGAESLYLEPGRYKLVAQGNNYPSGDFLSYLSLSWNDQDTTIVDTKPSSGLRIRRMKMNDGIDPANTIVKRYSYEEENGRSSGILETQLSYSYPHIRHYLNDPGAGADIHLYTTYTSNNQSAMSTTSGSHIGYRRVIEHYGDNDELGKVVYNYTSAIEYPDDKISVWPYVGGLSRNWRKGLITKKETFNTGGAVVSTEQNFYSKKNLHTAQINGTRVGVIMTTAYGSVTDRYFVVQARNLVEWFNLDSTIVSIDGVTVETAYDYDIINGNHTNPIATTMTNSDGKVHRTEIDYAHEKGQTDLINKFMISIPLESRRLVDTKLQGGAKTEYQNFNGNMTLPKAFQEILHNTKETERVTLDYDSEGHVRTQIRLGFAPETYVWADDLLQSRNFLNFNWSYTYYPNNRQLETITDIKGLVSSFEYDQFQRLQHSEARNGGLFADYKYHYTLAGGGEPNYVEVYTNEDDVTRHNYIDGLGRELQTLSLGYGPGRGDVVHGAVEYDEFGRVQRQFQPHPGSGQYNSPGGPHDRLDYEFSPLSRELKRTFADGSNMQTSYASNSASDAVTNYQTGGTYPDGELYKVTVLDEKGHPTITFRDKIGRVILIRKKWEGNNVDTYYQYDDRNNLIAVMPPGCSSPTDIHVGYQYSYDERNRMDTKKLPGAGTQTFKYNNRDQVTFSTDGNGNVVGYEYDGHGRDTLTLLQKPSSQQAVPIIYRQYDGNGGGSMGELVSENKSLLNGSSSNAIQTSYSYDEFGRVRRMQDGAYRGGSDNFEYTYEAATDRVSQIIRNYGQFGWQERYLYDHVGREKVQLHKMTRGSLYDSPVATARASEYDIKDQLISKSLDYLQTIGYGYDLRGRLIQINKLPLPYDDTYAPIECGGSGGSPPPPPPPAGTACGGQEVGLEDLLDIIASDDPPEIDCPTNCVEEEQPEICDFSASGAGHIICGIRDANGISVISYDPPIPVDDPTAATTLENDLQTFLTTYNFVYDDLSVTVATGGISVILTGTNFNLGGIDVCIGPLVGAVGNCQRVDGFPVGTPVQVGQQQASMQTLSGVMANTTVNTVQYPTTLYKVNLYEREVAFVLESEKDIIEGEQTTDDCVEIETPTTVITFNQEDSLYQKSFSEVLQLRQGDSLDDSRFDGDSDCEDELPKCSLIETYDARMIQSSQVITSALPGPPPYYDLLAEPGHEEGVTINDRFWTANNIAYGECGWDVSFRTGGSNVNVLAYKVKIKGTTDPDAALPPGKIRLALHNGLDFVEIKEGNGTFNFFDTNGQLGEMTLTVADSQYISPYQLENMVLSMHVESTEFIIDGVEVEIEYEAPCEACSEEGVPCSPNDRAQQQIDVENLQNAFLLANANQYTYPVTLHQVEFCDGTRLYVLESELSTISGPYAIFQDIGIDSSEQTFSAYIGTTDSLMTFADFIELRKTNNNLTLDSPGCPVSVTYDQENFCGYSLEMEGASYKNIPNSNQVQVEYTEVIKEQCGSGTVIEHSREPAVAIIAVQKKVRVTANFLKPNQGHLKTLTLNTLNPSGSIPIDLNPNTAGSGINNFDPNDLRFNGNVDVFLAAIRRVVDHEIEVWKNSNGINILLNTYDALGGVNPTTGEGFVYLSFSLYHQPTNAYAAIDPAATSSLTYSQDGTDHWVVNPSLALSQEQINVSSGNAPCPAVSATYFDNVIDDQNVSFNQIPVVSVEPTPTRLYGSDCSSGNPTLVSACDRPKRLWNGTEYEECDYCTPDPPICSDANTEAQQAYVDSLKNLYISIDTSDLVLPDTLHQVMLCDGSLVYIFGQHLEDIPGGITTVQTIPVGTTGQTFEVGQPDTTDLFAMRLYYEPNGNVEKVRWQVKFQPEQQYKFKYDDLDRMEESTYSAQGWLSNAAYSENVTYKDGRGNIETLTRGGYNGTCSYVLIDDLIYTYDQGNKVIRIEDQSGNDRGFKYKPGAPGDEYRYDANGNMVYDWHKGIDTIGYNYLNLPGSIILGGAPLDYIYDAVGKKHRSPGPYDFVNNTHYSPDGFEAVYTDEGRVVPIFNDSLGIIDSFQYEWVMRDHLGNGRVYFSDLDKNLGVSSQTPQEVLQERHYYPFGMMFEGPFYAQVGPENEYTYNEKRFHREGDLKWYDYGFRWYDAVIARFPSLDPIADQFYHLTPYNYASNNPITNFDLWGLQGVDFNSTEVNKMTTYFNTNASKGFKKDDCMTCHIKGIEILTDNKIPRGDNSDGKNSINRQRKQMQKKGLAEDTETITFKDSNGKKAIAAGDVDSMDGSVAGKAAELSEGTENSVFGVSITDGYHTMTLTVINAEAMGPTQDGKPLINTSFILSDQGTNSGTLRKGNLQFNNVNASSELDQHLLEYVQDSSPNHFPAKIELHQIINPNR